ncbi:MAG: type II toxin-antitoxin system HicA family toxin [Prevotella sp.]|nr:type II toxin-antitoxin system HicA family toxin [Prevotella sp.]
MTSKDKLIERFKKRPKDFTYEETVKLLSIFGYKERTKGKTSGSRVRFLNDETKAFINVHKPHPGSIVKEWMVENIYNHLKEHKLI